MAQGAGVPAASAAKGKSAQVWRVGWQLPAVRLGCCYGCIAMETPGKRPEIRLQIEKTLR